MARKIVRTVDRTDGQQELPFYNVWERLAGMINYSTFDEATVLSLTYLGQPRTYGDITRSDESNGWVNPMRPLDIHEAPRTITRSMMGGRRNGRSWHQQLDAYTRSVCYPRPLGVISSGS